MLVENAKSAYFFPMHRPIPRPPCVCGPAGLLAGDVSGFGRASSGQAAQSPQGDGGGVFSFHISLSAGRPAVCLVVDFVYNRSGRSKRPDLAAALVDDRSGRVKRPDHATALVDDRSGRSKRHDLATALVDDHALSGADYLRHVPVGNSILSRFFNFHSFLSPVARLFSYFSPKCFFASFKVLASLPVDW